MVMSNKVIWAEGLLLQPQHFQQQERYFEQLIKLKPSAYSGMEWGLTQLSIDQDALTQGLISLDSAQGLFADGCLFDAPYRDCCPIPLAINEDVANCIVYLALPLQQNGKNDADFDTNEAKQNRYYIQDDDVLDNTTEKTDCAQVHIGKLVLRLVLATDDLTPFVTIPIAKIKEVRSNKHILLDHNFMPTCLQVQGAPLLSKWLHECHDLLVSRADMLSARMTNIQQAGTTEIADFLLLQTVNRYEPLFAHLCQDHLCHPEKLFLTLLQLMGELSTFTNDQRRPQCQPKYQHDNLWKSFADVFQTIKQALSMVLEQNATRIDLIERQFGIWVGELHDKDLLDDASFILAAVADVPSEDMRSVFPSHVKLAPVEQIRNLVSRALPGISISGVPVAPRQIPYHANYAYFSVDKKHVLWQALKQSAGLGVHIAGEYPGLKLELWAIRG